MLSNVVLIATPPAPEICWAATMRSPTGAMGGRLSMHPLRRGVLRLHQPNAGSQLAAQADMSVNWVSRMLLPDGSRKPESMPYGRCSGGSVNSTPRAGSSR
ncbi:hypothetical protein LAUMK35_05306 [Mycobacterium pseudokansasii]|uniref:Uncharacterized protein n=1 Tax=Mycobacterium pseudokansasii TaxID=2341080 RepID=A0A498QY67_9MYCO|nr:hypothetical protein LAUMK35_05306 [Mycobacterium pseudokansasii]VBA34360.1 hypothetical protein LAUMK21_05264 [Mycobacterium pseudokansasii]VBA55775.1 hypothetical protein LAUMK142_05248 [Mycobacterium pseudokansasii]